MGGTSYPGGRPPSNDLYRSSPRYVTIVHPQKNVIKAKYPHPPDFKQLPYPSNGRGLPAFGAGHNSKPFINSYALLSHDPMWLESFPHYNGSPSTAGLCASPPKPNTASSGEYSQGLSQSFIDGSSTAQFITQYPPPVVMPNPGLQVQHHLFPTQPLHPHPYHHPSLYNSGQMHPYVVVHSGGPDVMYSNNNSSVYFDNSYTVYSSDTTNFFQGDRPTDVYGHPGYAHLTSHVPLQNDQDSYCLNTYSGSSILPLDHPRTDSNQVQPSKKLSAVEEEAYTFVASFCPHLGEKPYCLPPVKRSKHPDKSIKQLALGMESEKRVLGSFERFFAEQQIPVLMLCHYPLTGFMQVYKHEMSSPDRDFISLPGEHSRSTLTLLLLSDVFIVTIVTVSIISGNSDFAYIQKGVHKAVAHIKRCSRVVSKWLTFLGVVPEVRQVIAFPNLKKAVLQRIAKDKQFQESLSSVSTLHVDDLSAPFEEEWSAPEHKQRFRQWMLEKVVCHKAMLTRENLHLVAGALLSPRLSQVDFVNDQSQIFPITETSRSPEATENLEDVSELKLTIDGVTKPFDWFMDEYVTCYYPKLDEVTYRVPPIHFNIQSLRKPSEYIHITPDGSLAVKPVLIAEESKHNILTNQNTAGQSKHNIITNQVSAGESKLKTLTNPDGSGQNTHNIVPSQVSAGESKVKTLTNHNSTYFVAGAMGRDQIHNRQDLGNIHKDNHNEFTPHGLPQHELPDALATYHLHSNLEHKEVPIYENQNHHLSSNMSQDSYLDSLGGDVQNQETSFSVSSSQSLDSVASSRKTPLSGTEMRPAASVYLEFLQDVDILSEVMTKDMRADEGENRVIGALEKLGQRYGPMFIICDYQYNNYLNKLREEMFSKGEAGRPIRAFGQTMRAEHDCLILHKKYGVLVVCIKAIGDNFRDWGASEQQKITSTNKILEKAVKQLEREEAMIRHVTFDLDKKLACHKLIALPNMTRESVEQALAADGALAKRIQDVLGHGAGLFLCSDELPAKFQSVLDDKSGSVWSKLVSWWKQVEQLLKKTGSEVSTKIYRQIVGRYCGLLSTVEVWSPTNPRVEVRNASEAVSECAGRFSKLVLLPRQLEALCSKDRRVFLYGPPGCGKTLVLMLKAREWLLAGHTVILVNSRPGSLEGFPYMYGVYKRLQEMMAQFEVHNYHLLMIRIDSLHFRAEDLAGVMPSCCVIMDEVSASCHEIIEHLCCLQVRNFWCAGLFELDKPTTTQVFTSHKMDKIIRCPPVIQSIMKHTEPDVNIQMPYRDIYQSSFLHRKSSLLNRKDADCGDNDKSSDKENSVILSSHPQVKKVNVLAETTSNKDGMQSGKESSPDSKFPVEMSSDKHSNEENYDKIGYSQEKKKESQYIIKYNPESLNERLQEKYKKTDNNSEMSRNKNEDHEKNYCSRGQRKESQSDIKSDVDLERLQKIGKTEENREISYDKSYDKEYHKTDCHQEQGKESREDVKYDTDSLNQRLQKLTRKVESSEKFNNKQHNEEHRKKTDSLQDQGSKNQAEVKSDLKSLKQKQQVSGETEETRNTPQISEQPKSFEPREHCSFEPEVYCSSSAEMGLPTDGPWPHIIDHSLHFKSGEPKDCFQCGQKVAEVLESLVRPDSVRDASTRSQQQSLHKNKQSLKFSSPNGGRMRATKPADSRLSSISSSSLHTKSSLQVSHKLNSSLDSRTLAWSDVLIVAQDMPTNCAFVAALRSRQIPVEVLRDKKTFQIEDLHMKKLFITQYKEVTGLERPVIVFVPSQGSDQLQPSRCTSSTLDFHLGQSIDRFSAEDRIILWHMASRSLASLLLVLP